MPTGRNRGAIALGFVVVALLVWLDQWSKTAVFDWLGGGQATLVTDIHGHRRYLVSGEWFSFMTSCNQGAAFGRFDSFPTVLVGGRILAVALLSVLLYRVDTRHRVVLTAMVLVLSGAVGNVVDNLWTGCGTEGAPFGVRDFINVWFQPLFGWDYHFPSFNVADACISVGAVLWVTTGFFHREEERGHAAGLDDESDADPSPSSEAGSADPVAGTDG